MKTTATRRQLVADDVPVGIEALLGEVERLCGPPDDLSESSGRRASEGQPP